MQMSCNHTFCSHMQSWGLSKVQSNRASLQPLIDEVCDIVRSDQFSAAVATLGLRNIAAENSQEGGACSDGGRAGKSRMYPVGLLPGQKYSKIAFFV